MARKIALFLCVLVASIYGLNTFVESKLAKLTHDDIYNDCHKVWSARGIYNSKAEENTLLSIGRAADAGAKGVEVDFFYYPEDDRFYVDHDFLSRDENGVFLDRGEKPLTLETLFAEESELHYWLDYKNVGRMSDAETQKAIARLTKISQVNNIKERLYIEGSNPLVLGEYTRAGFKTILAMDLLPMENPLSEYLINLYKMVYYSSDISAVARRHGALSSHSYNAADTHYDPSIADQLSGIPYFLFHTPDDADTLEALANDPTVRVMLVGRDDSINRFDLSACEK